MQIVFVKSRYTGHGETPVYKLPKTRLLTHILLIHPDWLYVPGRYYDMSGVKLFDRAFSDHT